jgi:hypothetical protein
VVEAPATRRLGAGLPAVVQRSTLSPTAEVRLVVAGSVQAVEGFDVVADDPVVGATRISARCLPREVPERFAALAGIAARGPVPIADEAAAASPGEAARRLFDRALSQGSGGEDPAVARPGPLVVLVVGDVETTATFELLERGFGAVDAGVLDRRGPSSDRAWLVGTAPEPAARPAGTAQSQVGYLVAAPHPATEPALAWRLALYVLAHGYEGRLGKEAISRRGLIYWIDAEYRSDGRRGWIELLAGVDPEKRVAMGDLLGMELRGLVERPPSGAEIAEARHHLVGRRRTAAQSNEELASLWAGDWVLGGRLLDPETLELALEGVGDDAVRAAAAELSRGIVLLVE